MKYQLVTERFRGSVRLFLAILLLVGLTRCSSTGPARDDADGQFAQAEEAFKDEHYLTAMEKFRDVKNRFPYSSRAVDAELRIADTHYAQENYLEAASAYEIFKELHPTHAKSDYVQFRIGMSYFQQIPENTARDLSAAHKAIESFGVVGSKFPSSSFVAEAKSKAEDAKRKLAEHESYVADFYFRRNHFLSASYRYSALLQQYPDLGYDEEALFRLGKCYAETKMHGDAKDALRRLLSKYPSTSFKGEAQSLLNDLTGKP